MAANSSGFTIAAGMGLIVLLMGYTLLNAAGLVGLASEPQPLECGVVAADTTYAEAPEGPARYPLLTEEDAALASTGDALFKNNCAQCHAINDRVVGPALAGINQRRPMSWLIPWVKNSSKMVASGDAYAVKIFNEYSKQQMPSFALTDDEIKAVLKYVEVEESHRSFAVAAVVD
ncbi:hypothetical protein GCM10023185_34880 [Hymenobacter saemangeumensis]|uniref:Cytochrome c domain-containing protein n=1 Tax=Hymenobacter saemangeumensis TaxID=1084522 RepID=A0ABP8IP37_9BACT